jgi:UDP-N-acetylmuramate dehydrogenase
VNGSVAGAAGRAPAATAVVALAEQLQGATGIQPRVGKRLAVNTTMRVGGPADLVAVAANIAAIVALIQFAIDHEVPWTVLGRGSNVVVADAGLRGLVILNRAEGTCIDGERLIAESGLPLAKAAMIAQRAGLSGLEFGLAIPGTVGGAVWANAGAHGSDVAAVLESVSILRGDGTETVQPAAALALSYRDSRFKHPTGQGSGLAPADVILTATFRLSTADPADIKTRLDDIRRWRLEHQPLSQPSAGSVFRNPPGDSAGRMIDACGLKGRRVGGAEISEKHANFIINAGGATASDIRRLAETARAEVAARFGTELAYEVQFIGDWSNWQQEVS